MKTLNRTVSGREYLRWIALSAVFSILAMAIVLSLVLVPASVVLGGLGHEGFLFFFYFAMVFGFCSVLPAVIVASVTVGRVRGIGLSLLPEKAIVTRLFRKVRFQFVRNGFVVVTLVFLVIFALDRLGL